MLKVTQPQPGNVYEIWAYNAGDDLFLHKLMCKDLEYGSAVSLLKKNQDEYLIKCTYMGLEGKRYPNLRVYLRGKDDQLYHLVVKKQSDNSTTKRIFYNPIDAEIELAKTLEYIKKYNYKATAELIIAPRIQRDEYYQREAINEHPRQHRGATAPMQMLTRAVRGEGHQVVNNNTLDSSSNSDDETADALRQLLRRLRGGGSDSNDSDDSDDSDNSDDSNDSDNSGETSSEYQSENIGTFNHVSDLGEIPEDIRRRMIRNGRAVICLTNLEDAQNVARRMGVPDSSIEHLQVDIETCHNCASISPTQCPQNETIIQTLPGVSSQSPIQTIPIISPIIIPRCYAGLPPVRHHIIPREQSWFSRERTALGARQAIWDDLFTHYQPHI